MHVGLIGDAKLPLAEGDGMSVFVAGLECAKKKEKKRKKMNVRR